MFLRILQSLALSANREHRNPLENGAYMNLTFKHPYFEDRYTMFRYT
jgi:hypothetical protein